MAQMGSCVISSSSLYCIAAFILVFSNGIMGSNAVQVVFNVKSYGAKGDGLTDDSEAMMKAWRAACKTAGRPHVVVPRGTYLSGPLQFVGPCLKAQEIILEVKGKMIAQKDLSLFKTDQWISFRYINGLVLQGGGIFDGRGASAWKANDCARNSHCRQIPMSLSFDFVTNSIVSNISSVNSKNTHILFFASKNVTARDLNIVAPSDSPNTDGIHISESTGIRISRTTISTGDDCISILPGSRHVSISKVFCGPGHGISVGSLGRKSDHDVSRLTVKNCTFVGTQNGLRIKTWPGPGKISAKNLTFENILMKNVNNPIVIDQDYCPYDACPYKGEPSEVKVMDINYRNVTGTSASEVAVKLVCSKKFPCEVELNNINLKYVGSDAEKGATSICSNVKGVFLGTQNPHPCT